LYNRFTLKPKKMKSKAILFLMSLLVLTGMVVAQDLHTPNGVKMISNKSFDDSEQARQEILDIYKDLRLTDVLDGMDLIGLQDIGLMHNEIRPLWRDVEDFSHRVIGFAVTVRYVPTDLRVGQNSFESTDEAKIWKSEQYGRAKDTGWVNAGKPGDVVVMDVNGIKECGNIGSNNSLGWAKAGFVGVITNGGARDTDEIIKTKGIPVYCINAYSTRGIRPGRLIIESYNFPMNCGGVLVFPGDLVVADGDGVIVVPREHAREVGELARGVMTGDQKSRAKKYKDLGLPIDETVEPFIEKQ
jgi:4-hydroxy-4-methyl-2-oxoglutarate aldolase